ncbi:hypothetical protein Poly51_39710 [Rubripirellula tenax]|uniref:Uncharacterized protein n=1 Tax=Rubripirellula tenax TaxID=2528015 RepID=A0A5C6EP92_9BACT|nr:hypothetical protein [Rubripirellula tenax]TWU50678.1 hypothetical protein Poly51_39710 [Rubripirellula tenax]
MKRKLLLDHANTLCQMLYSRRLERDRDILIALPAGTVTVDVLTGAVSHDTAGHLDTAFGDDFADWFREKRDDAGIPDDYIVSATLTIAIDPARPHPSDWLGPFDRWSPKCDIVTRDRTYAAEIGELGEFRPMM